MLKSTTLKMTLVKIMLRNSSVIKNVIEEKYRQLIGKCSDYNDIHVLIRRAPKQSKSIISHPTRIHTYLPI